MAALIGIGPKNEIEGMIASQPLTAHYAAIECYRPMIIGEQTFEGRREPYVARVSKRSPSEQVHVHDRMSAQ